MVYCDEAQMRNVPLWSACKIVRVIVLQIMFSCREIPDYWTYCSYVFCFQSLLCGPFCFYDEYMDFIEGRCVQPAKYKKTDPAASMGGDQPDLLPPVQVALFCYGNSVGVPYCVECDE